MMNRFFPRTRDPQPPPVADISPSGSLLVGLDASRKTPVHCDPGATAVIVGSSGSGRSTMLATRIARLAALGTRVAVVAPYWAGNGWFRGVDGRAIRVGPASTWRYDPFELRGRLPDERADDLRPLFSVLLGEHFDALADEILRVALLEFYAAGDEEGMAGFVSVLSRFERSMTPLAGRKREELVSLFEQVALRGPLAHYFHLPSDPLPDDSVRRLLVHPESVQDPRERALLFVLALSIAADTLLAGPGPGALAVDDADAMLSLAPSAVDDALVAFTRSGRHQRLGLSMTMALASPTRPGWYPPHILGMSRTWIFLPADPDLVRGWSRILPHPIDPGALTAALEGREGERRAALVEDGIVIPVITVLLPGEEDILGGNGF